MMQARTIQMMQLDMSTVDMLVLGTLLGHITRGASEDFSDASVVTVESAPKGNRRITIEVTEAEIEAAFEFISVTEGVYCDLPRREAEAAEALAYGGPGGKPVAAANGMRPRTKR